MRMDTKYVIPMPAISRRTLLAGGTAAGAGLLLGRMARAESSRGIDGPLLKEYDIAANGISLHVTEQGEGPAVLFCHGFPDTSYTWRRQMTAISSAGYRAIAPDMRGYGSPNLPFSLRGRRMAWRCFIHPSKNSAPAFPVSWGISKSIMWATGYNTKPLPRSVTSS